MPDRRTYPPFSVQRLGEDVIGYAHALKVEALAGLGELLKQTPKAKGTDRGGRSSKLDGSRVVPSNSPPTLAEMGIDKKTSSLAQRLAGLLDAELDTIASREKTLAEVTRTKTAEARSVRLSLPDAKYRIVYADPPWEYRDTADVGAVQASGAAMKYPTTCWTFSNGRQNACPSALRHVTVPRVGMIKVRIEREVQ